MTQDFMDLLQDLTQNESLFKLNALAYKKTYDALVAEGFSAEAAIRILSARGFAGLEIHNHQSSYWG